MGSLHVISHRFKPFVIPKLIVFPKTQTPTYVNMYIYTFYKNIIIYYDDIKCTKVGTYIVLQRLYWHLWHILVWVMCRILPSSKQNNFIHIHFVIVNVNKCPKLRTLFFYSLTTPLPQFAIRSTKILNFPGNIKRFQPILSDIAYEINRNEYSY